MEISKPNVEEEFHKNPELKEEVFQDLRQWITHRDDIPRISDYQIILFLHSCYYSLENTKKCIEVYYKIKRRTHHFFGQRDITLPEMQKALQVLYFSIFPVKHPNGCRIIFHSLQQYEPSNYVYADGVKLLLMSIEASLQIDGTSPGIIILFDMKGVRLGHVARAGIFDIRKMIHFLQEGLPVRLKAIHIINVVPFIDKIMALAKPFMKKELYNILHFHSGDVTKVHEYIPADCLPEDYGGNLPSLPDLHDQHIELLHKLQAFFKEDDIYESEETGEI